MILEDYQILDELLEEFRQEEAEIDIEIESNIRCIRKADVVLKEFRDSESEDYKVFSPRKMEVVHKREIEQADKEKSVYEEKNRILYRRKDLLGRRIFKLEEILKRQDYAFISGQDSEEVKSGEELQKASIQKINDIMIKLENSSQYLEHAQIIQARQEFMIVKKFFSDLMEMIKSSIWIR